MKCPYCGKELRNNVRYCGNCGHKVSSPLASTPSNSSTILSSSLNSGSQLQNGRYIVKRILGQGGMGAALLATDIRLDNKLVVIKELISESVDQTHRLEDVRNFKREVAMLAHIDHPLVPNVTDHFQEDTRYFMVQEYIDGENLEEYLNRANQPLAERETLICASEILDVLDYLSQQVPPIVHRDIKPANIIIGTKDRRAHLVDFGIARPDEVNKQTAALGTPGYAPPEQYQGKADPRSDLYALAATLHHLLTNRDPRNYAPFSYPPVRTSNPQVSAETESILTHALNNNVNQRYQNALDMKQEIDSVLQQRFGLSGNIDNYTLGTSGQMKTLPATGASTFAITRQPTVLQTSTPPQLASPQPAPITQPGINIAPITPLPNVYMGGQTPAAGYPPLLMAQNPSSKPGQNQRKSRLPIAVLMLIVLLLLIGSYGAYLFLIPSARVAAIGISTIAGEPIGISDGTTAIDTTLADGTLKTQAAQQLKQGNNNNAAISLLNQALAKNSNDAEALIYQEDIHVVDAGTPYVTLVVATMLSGAQVQVGRDDLQGAYVAQKEFNDASRLQGGMQVRLLIANTGSQTSTALSNVNKVVQQIIQLQRSDPTFVGVMGWPFSGRTQAAIEALSEAHIPMVSQTSSSDSLTAASPYFLRVVPANTIQGIQGAKYAEQTLHAKKVALFYDEQDTYSESLAQDFREQFGVKDKNTIIEENYTIGDAATIASAVQKILKQGVDLIYFSGYASDVSTLLSNLPVGNLPVMGGDALYELGGYQSSARANFSRLRFTAFAYPDEWEVLGYKTQKPAFFNEYSAAFNPDGQHAGGSYGFTRTDNDVMLSYDATVALLTAYNNALGSGKKNPTPEDENQALHAINGSKAIQGVGGQIAFGSNGDPINKAIVVLYVDQLGRIHMEPTVLGRFLK